MEEALSEHDDQVLQQYISSFQARVQQITFIQAGGAGAGVGPGAGAGPGPGAGASPGPGSGPGVGAITLN